MKFKYLSVLLSFITFSCSAGFNANINKNSFSSSGFAYLYDDEDYLKKIISKRFKNDEMQVAHNRLKPGTLVKIINPENKKTIILKTKKKIDYPKFYQILITEPVFNKLQLNIETPYVEIQELKKNKSFIAGQANTHIDERKVSSKAPVTSVKIDNISKNKTFNNAKSKNFLIIIAEFYSQKSAKSLRDKLNSEVLNKGNYKVLIKKKNKNSFELVLGPYKAVNSLKNDYIALIDYGFEDLDIIINE